MVDKVRLTPSKDTHSSTSLLRVLLSKKEVLSTLNTMWLGSTHESTLEVWTSSCILKSRSAKWLRTVFKKMTSRIVSSSTNSINSEWKTCYFQECKRALCYFHQLQHTFLAKTNLTLQSNYLLGQIEFCSAKHTQWWSSYIMAELRTLRHQVTSQS